MLFLCWKILFYLAAIWMQWKQCDSETRRKYLGAARVVSFLTVEVSLLPILLQSQLSYKSEILLLVLTALNLVLFLIGYDGERKWSNPVYVILRANELALIVINSCYIEFLTQDATSRVLGIILFVLTGALAFVRIRDVFTKEVSSVEEVWSGIKLTMLTLTAIYSYTVLLDESAYMFSLVCMLTALACIIAGFLGHKQYLRLYGLVLTLLCVFKLVTYDVSDLDTYLRVIALIGGGIICFITSAIYNYSTKKIDTVEEAKQ
jgi:uncharacterized membrane protein